MTSATVNGVTTTFAYRGDGLRDSRTTGGVTTTFAWDIADGLPVVLADGSKYVYGAGLISQTSGANTYTCDVYGKKTSSTGSQANEFDFAGLAQP